MIEIMKQRLPISGTSQRLAALLASAMLVVACGDGTQPTTTDEPAPTVTDPAPADADDNGEASDWDSIVEAANEEGEVVLYLAYPAAEKISEGFAAAYPDINLEIIQAATGDLVSRMESERETGADGADVALVASAQWYTATNDDFLTPLGPAAEAWGLEGQNHAVGVIGVPIPLGYNTQVLDELGISIPTGFDSLIDERLSDGLIGIGSIDIGPVVVQHYYRLHEHPDYGREFLESLAALNPVVYPGVSAAVQALGAGEHALIFWSQPLAIAELIEAGAPVGEIALDPNFAPVVGGAIVSWSGRPNAAQVLLDWLLQETGGQLALHSDGTSGSMRYDVPGQFDLSNAVIADGILTPEMEQFRDEIWPTLGFPDS